MLVCIFYRQYTLLLCLAPFLMGATDMILSVHEPEEEEFVVPLGTSGREVERPLCLNCFVLIDILNKRSITMTGFYLKVGIR